jgi:cell division protein FtsI (penicillin-binding protein 3)
VTDVRKDILWRVYLVYFTIFFFGLMIVAKIMYIQFKEGDRLREIAESQEIVELTLEANRGNILAADGSLLATSVPVFEVRMDVASPYFDDKLFYEKVDSIAHGLETILGKRSKTYYKNYLIKARKKKNRYLLLGRKVTYAQLKKIKKLPILKHGKYKGGLITIQTTRRELPFNELAARTIGYEIQKEKLFIGLEGAYSEVLTGKNGKQFVRKINNGDLVPIHDENEIEPKDGLDVVSTIDVNIQDVAENALLRQLLNHKAFQGCAVIMEVETGYVRAIANLRYDSADGKYKETYNYAVGASIEPGSTFKLPNIMTALEYGNIKLTDSVITGEGFAVVKGMGVQDVKKMGNGRVTVREVFESSSNVGMALVMNRAFENEPTKYVDRLYAMSLNQPLGVEISGEGMPVLKHPSDRANWYGTTLTALSFGYELQITPLQTLAFYNAVANNGKMVKPLFVTEIKDGVTTKKAFEPQVLNEKIASDETIKQAKSLLEGAVTRGTGKTVFKDTPYSIAGKTGTAKISEGGKYHKIYNASFAGYFPADNPKYSCIVVINKPTNGKYYGGSVAAPAFKEIADKLYSTLLVFDQEKVAENLSPYKPQHSSPANYYDLKTVYAELGIKTNDYLHEETWSVVVNVNENLEFESAEFAESKVPNVKGMSAKDAVFLLESMGLSANISGRGKVKSQSIKAGSEIKNGSEINLQLAVY